MAISVEKIAEQFLRDQIRIMKKHGKAPKLTLAQKRQLLSDIQASFDSLRNGRKDHKAA